ncbi:MAG: Arginine-tRNA ligase [Candidatus Jorgensenbacteria bacterium GW2011_GWA1_48_11]|uniref:Arginine--tRNA ligase n=1 Tax=Candidatus Jorgensenbacteria bacterium GW2011_GWA1_48_11 TaxID=1618660 RepID=A0A0G1UBN8_9BACT|nr:MAG: Arginine-tRNA ligase [Candidatus Jorgensenbacteria bacterium GW2011_GWA1_48_11]KKW12027.1 MAG: Arginine-tRNA ligase [Candidatus Jorgensenbacteria bacterium GW2011_GWB1_49_9]
MREKVLKFLRQAVRENVKIEITSPDEEKQGHYSTNVAFRLAQKRGGTPYQEALTIAAAIKKAAPKNLFQKIEVAGPGFINFWIAPEAWHESLKEILRGKKNYGRVKAASKKKIQLEFVSANPTGPLTLANGRGGFLGDILGNVLSAAGHKVEREYYVNDTGNQVLTLGKSMVAALKLIPKEEQFYKGEYIEAWANKNSVFVKKNAGQPIRVGQKAAGEFLKAIRLVLEKKARIRFNRYTSEEKDVRKKGFVEKALRIFKRKKLTYEKEGALWLKTTKFDDDKDRVIVKSNGDPTYILADSGHNLETKARRIDRKILILGPDHYGYVARMKAAASIIGLDLEILITQALRLVEGGREVKMSKRKGAFVTFEELVSEVGADAARFFFLMHAPESHMDFDLGLAKERSNKNPVYYTQYAYVRARNIAKKAKFKPTHKNLASLKTPQDIALLKQLARFPEFVSDSAEDYRVHRLTRYAIELAKTFHNFYEKERVIGESNGILADARLSLVHGALVVFENLLDILGLTKPSKM